MCQKKAERISPWNLTEGQVVWSSFFKAYIVFVEKDYDSDLLFKFLDEDRYCVIISDEIYEPEGLIKELL
jgi:hypothetical protein